MELCHRHLPNAYELQGRQQRLVKGSQGEVVIRFNEIVIKKKPSSFLFFREPRCLASPRLSRVSASTTDYNLCRDELCPRHTLKCSLAVLVGPVMASLDPGDKRWDSLYKSTFSLWPGKVPMEKKTRRKKLWGFHGNP